MKSRHPYGLNVLGFYPYGDLGPLTIYTNRKRRVVAFDRAPPLSPPSWLQKRQRYALTAAAKSWSSLNATDRLWWEDRARLNHLKITAFNLYMHVQLTHDTACLGALL